MKTIDITEHKVLNQSKRIFNNSRGQMISKLNEEFLELKDELTNEKTAFSKENVINELGDLAYVLCQLMDNFDTNYRECLNYAIKKIDKREREGRIKLKK